MGALAGLPWGKIIMVVLLMAAGAYVAHHWDKGVIEHQKGLLVAEKLAHQKAVSDALVWATEKQKVYDNEAIKSARLDADQQRALASDASERARALAAIPPRVLVRGCITYEFVRHLDAAIVAHGPASALPLPAGKPSDTCAPVDAVTVVRWLLGIVETAQANGQQLNDLIAFFRSTQAAR
jgi:hypothetical protein